MLVADDTGGTIWRFSFKGTTEHAAATAETTASGRTATHPSDSRLRVPRQNQPSHGYTECHRLAKAGGGHSMFLPSTDALY